MDPTAETTSEPASTEWFVAGRNELFDAFLDEPDAVAVLTD